MKGLITALLLVATQCAAAHSKHLLLKRQATANPLEPVVEQLSQALEELQAQVTALQNRLDEQTSSGGGPQTMSVAFMAQYKDDNAVGIANGPYVFDNAVLNRGNGYDPTTGIFTAPVSGIYLIATQLFTDGGDNEHPFVDIKVNNQTLARLAFEADGEEDSDSTTVTAHLQAGDQVFIQSDEGLQYHYWGMFHSFFTGTLIAADPAMPLGV